MKDFKEWTLCVASCNEWLAGRMEGIGCWLAGYLGINRFFPIY